MKVSRCFLCDKETTTPIIAFDKVRGRTLKFCSKECKERQIGGYGLKHYNKFPRTRKLQRFLQEAEDGFYVQNEHIGGDHLVYEKDIKKRK